MTDANGCTTTVSGTITEPSLLVAGETHTDACLTASDGTIDVTVSGGASPYSYLWGDGPITEDRSGLAAGSYTLVVTDANGCTASVNVTVGVRSYTIAASAGANGTITPNGSVPVSCGADQSFTITASPGYHVLDVVVDGGSQGVQTSWTFTNVQANHTIAATFAANPPVAAVANLVATQVRTGNPAGQVTQITLTWDAVPVGTTVEVWRAPYGHYPVYDEAGGAEPAAVPSHSTTPPAPWVLTAVTASGGLDLPPTRDFYYYVAYAKDGYGTWSTASNRTAGTLNYHLGDVSDGYTAGVGNNQVFGRGHLPARDPLRGVGRGADRLRVPRRRTDEHQLHRWPPADGPRGQLRGPGDVRAQLQRGERAGRHRGEPRCDRGRGGRASSRRARDRGSRRGRDRAPVAAGNRRAARGLDAAELGSRRSSSRSISRPAPGSRSRTAWRSRPRRERSTPR